MKENKYLFIEVEESTETGRTIFVKGKLVVLLIFLSYLEQTVNHSRTNDQSSAERRGAEEGWLFIFNLSTNEFIPPHNELFPNVYKYDAN